MLLNNLRSHVSYYIYIKKEENSLHNDLMIYHFSFVHILDELDVQFDIIAYQDRQFFALNEKNRE